MKPHAPAILIAAALVAAAAQAQPAGPPRGPGPGGPRAHLFISPAGEPFRGEGGLQAWFAGADGDHDGAVTLAEFRADAQRFFQLLDANHDSRIDGFEMQDYERNRAPEIADMFQGRRSGGGGERPRRRKGGDKPAVFGLEGAARFSLINVAQPVANADADVDGRVTVDEWTRAATRRFALLDKAATGRLTLETLPPLPGTEPAPEGGKPRR